MENRSVKSTQTEGLEQWVNNAVVSLSASLVFGREKASQISQPLLIALFTLTSNDYKKALEVIISINDFSVKRIFLEQFKYCYKRDKLSSQSVWGRLFEWRYSC